MDMQINKNFLRTEREKRAWSQSHLAEVAGLSMRTVQRIERGGVASMESTKALAAALDLELSRLTGHPIEHPSAHINRTKPGIFTRRGALGSVGALLAILAALGWWSTAAAEQVMINLSIKTPDGEHSDIRVLNDIGQQSEVVENQLRVLINATRQGEFLLLGAEIYNFEEGEYHLLSSPSILIEKQKPAAVHINSASGDQISLLFIADY
jgi:transcriptional regulator with XRE-family HTH domain